MDYLDRPQVENVSYEITETCVSIQCPHTCFLSCVLPTRCQKDAMLGQYRRVLQIAKERKIRISYSRHIRRTIREQWSDYIIGRERQEQLFQELREVAGTIQLRGIHQGYVDDEELAKAQKIVGELDKLRYSDKAVRDVAGLEYELHMLERQLSDSHRHFDMIAL